MTKLFLKVAAACAVMTWLAGCGPHQTVEWYTAHASERAEKVKWCQDDAARQADADCMNAIKSAELARLAAPATNFTFSAGAPASAAASLAKPPVDGRTAAKGIDFKFTPPSAPGGK